VMRSPAFIFRTRSVKTAVTTMRRSPKTPSYRSSDSLTDLIASFQINEYGDRVAPHIKPFYSNRSARSDPHASACCSGGGRGGRGGVTSPYNLTAVNKLVKEMIGNRVNRPIWQATDGTRSSPKAKPKASPKAKPKSRAVSRSPRKQSASRLSGNKKKLQQIFSAHKKGGKKRLGWE